MPLNPSPYAAAMRQIENTMRAPRSPLEMLSAGPRTAFDADAYFADGGEVEVPAPAYMDPMGGMMQTGDSEAPAPGAYERAAQIASNVGAAVGRPLVAAGRGATEIPGTVGRYFADVSAGPDPSQRLAEDLKKFGSMVWQHAKEDPVGTALDIAPVIGEIRSGMDAEKLSREADAAEAAGNLSKASQLRQLAAVATAGAAPLLGTAARLGKRGAKAGVEAAEAGVEAGARAATEGAEAGLKPVVEAASEAAPKVAAETPAQLMQPMPVMKAFDEAPEPVALREGITAELTRSITETDGAKAQLPTTMGLGPMYVVESGVQPTGKGFILTGTTNKNAAGQIAGIDPLMQRFPEMALDPDQWAKGMAEATGKPTVLSPPYRFMKAMRDGEYENLLRGLTEGQIRDADAGFANGKLFKEAYTSGAMDVADTGKLFMWGILSRGVDPFTHEGLFLDAFNGIEPWVKMAAEGKFTKEIAEGPYKKWAETAAPKGSGQAGAGATHNLNAFGRDFLLKMGTPSKDGITPLQKLHDMMSDPNMSGRQIRRAFAETGEGVGIDNKVVSFILLATGRDDVMVIDRIQLKNLWDDGRFADLNIWDGVNVPVVKLKGGATKRFPPTDEGRAAANAFSKANPGSEVKKAAVTGGSLAEATYGAKGILVYEALENALMREVGPMYERLGRPGVGSPGRFHWETWVARSNQEASHGTLGSILSSRQGNPDPLRDVYSKQGDYQTYAYGAKYAVSPEGPHYRYQLSTGEEVRLAPQVLSDVLERVKNPKYGVVPKNFKVSDTTGRPWYEREGVNRARLDELIREAASGQAGPVRKAVGGPVSDGTGPGAGGLGVGAGGRAAGAPARSGLTPIAAQVANETAQIARQGGVDRRRLAFLLRMASANTMKPETAFEFAGNILDNDLKRLRQRFFEYPRSSRILSRVNIAMGGETNRQFGTAVNMNKDANPLGPVQRGIRIKGEGFAKGGRVAKSPGDGAMRELVSYATKRFGAKNAKNMANRANGVAPKMVFAISQMAKNQMLANPQRFTPAYKQTNIDINRISRKYNLQSSAAINLTPDAESTHAEIDRTLASESSKVSPVFRQALMRLRTMVGGKE